MNGYPKVVATVQDYKNLLADPNYQAQALQELQNLVFNFDDRGVNQPTTSINPNDPNSDYNTVEVVNPYPVHRQKGFTNWYALVALYAKNTLSTGQTVHQRFLQIMATFTPTVINDAPVVVT
jgi:hypothetical protein